MDPETLSRVAYFAGCGREAIAVACAVARERSVRAGETILSEGDKCQDLFFVMEGRVRVVKYSPEGREQVLLILGVGRSFNDVPVFDGGLSPGTVEALEDSRIGVIPAEQMRNLARRYPEIALGATRILASRLRTMTLMVQTIAFRDVVGRVANVIRGCASGEQPLIEGVPHACARITQQELATMTGSVREVVQRALKTSETAGAIKLGRARIEVLNSQALDDWAASDS